MKKQDATRHSHIHTTVCEEMPVAKCQLLHIVFVAFELRSKQLVVSIAQYVYEDQSDQKKRKEIRLNGVTNCP